MTAATVVAITTRHTSDRGAGVAEFLGTDRAAVHEAAMNLFRQCQREWRDPSYPATHATPDGGWKAVVSYWSAE